MTRLTTAELRDRDSLLARLRDSNVLAIAVANEDRVFDANDAFLDMIGYTREDLATDGVDWKAITPPEWVERDVVAVDQLRSTGACEPFEKEFFHRSGRRVPVLLGAAVVEHDPLTWIVFLADLSERQRAEEERAELVASAHAAQLEAQNAEEQLNLLLGAGALVAATHSREDMLGQVTRLVVPSVADLAAVFLPTEDDSLRATAAVHRDPAATAVLKSLLDDPISPGNSVAFQAAYLTGKSQLVQDVAAHRATWPELDPRLGEVAEQLNAGSFIAIALTQGAEHLGVFVLGRSYERPVFNEFDLAVAEELGRRISVGLTNVDTFARDHSVSEVLQRSVLPDELPSVPGVDLAVVYLPATEGVDVGGDWYDAFPLGEGLLGVVIGDVVGHNVAAASAMSQVRNALRAFAVDDPRPDRVLERTNSALARLMPEAMATVFLGVLDVSTGELTYADAGHPPPVMTGLDGPEYLSGAGGLMLGVADDAEYDVATHHLPPGSGLLLFSDGLVEDRGRPIEEGLDALAGALGDHGVTSAAEMCARAKTALLESPTRADDVCMLAVYMQPVS